jgi:hypothetical protein
MELRSIVPGKVWEVEIGPALQRCRVVVVLLSRDWAGIRDDGQRRMDAEDDVFRLEAARALQFTAIVISVLVGEVPVPRTADLPPGLDLAVAPGCGTRVIVHPLGL